MHYWISKHYPLAAISFTTKLRLSLVKPATLLAIFMFTLYIPPAIAGGSAPALNTETISTTENISETSQVRFQPHEAVYTGDFSGFKADMKQSFTQLNEQQWRLHNSASILFVGFVEAAQFSVIGNNIIANNYEYVNKLSNKRSSSLIFDHKKNTVVDSNKSATPLAIPADALDKIGLEMQIRLDLINHGDQFPERIYNMVGGGKIKHYQIKYLGEEKITVPAGTFQAVKLEQRSVGATDKTTFIWFAKDFDYLLLHIHRIDKDKDDIHIRLKSAEINGKKI